MSTAQINQLLAAMFACGNLWPALRMFLLALGSQEGYCSAIISIKASAATAPFDYPLCGDDTD